MMKNIINFLCVGWILCGVACSVDETNKTQETSRVQDRPESVDLIQDKAKNITINDLGYWEAEFENDHIMIYIPEGEFTMGSHDGLSNEKPVHKVYIDGYWMGKHPVTVGQFRNFVEETGQADQSRVNRGGGSWTDRSGHLTPKGGHNLRSAARTGDEQNSSDDHMGFRLCIDTLSR